VECVKGVEGDATCVSLLSSKVDKEEEDREGIEQGATPRMRTILLLTISHVL
jgi:hypothetical protein